MSESSEYSLRFELELDIPFIHALHCTAFEKPDVANLVDALRNDGTLSVSLVAEKEGEVVGHVAASPITIDGSETSRWFQLSPLGVHPNHQKQGIGAALVLKILKETAEIGGQGTALLGAPKYYSRFGFRPSTDFGLKWERGGGPFFQAVNLSTENAPTGTVRLHPAFDDVE